MEKNQRLQMRSDPAFLRLIDDWRRRQPEIPSRSEAVRTLVYEGLLVDSWMNLLDLAQAAKAGLAGQEVPPRLRERVTRVLQGVAARLENITEVGTDIGYEAGSLSEQLDAILSSLDDLPDLDGTPSPRATDPSPE